MGTHHNNQPKLAPGVRVIIRAFDDIPEHAFLTAGPTTERGEEKTVMIDATHLKARRTATSLGAKEKGVDL